MRRERNAAYELDLAIGKEMHAERNRVGLLQKESAYRLGEQPATLCGLENGIRQWRVSQLVAVCKLYGCDPLVVLKRALERIAKETNEKGGDDDVRK